MRLNLTLLGLAMVLLSTSYAQLKVHSNGTVSIATTSSSGYALTVAGYSAINMTYAGSHLRLSPSTANSVIGCSADRIAFWESAPGHHQLDASSFHVTSDSSLKMNIVPLDSGVQKLMALETYTYNYKPEYESAKADGEQRTHYGFLAQEVEKVLPDLVDSSMGVLTINYDQFIPLLVESVQIQQNTIDSLTARITDLEASVYDGGIHNKSAGVTTLENGQLVELGQNNPNPFKESTTIPYVIPPSATSAQIIIYDMRGVELESYPITEFGANQLLIEGNTFKAGMYLYALIVDGQYIDSKRMILSK
jgi:hypothetical protein